MAKLAGYEDTRPPISWHYHDGPEGDQGCPVCIWYEHKANGWTIVPREPQRDAYPSTYPEPIRRVTPTIDDAHIDDPMNGPFEQPERSDAPMH
jgi:hypothetical protein